MSYINALSEIEQAAVGEFPWCDLIFDIVDHQPFELRKGDITITCVTGVALADFKGETIGFAFCVPLNGWRLSANQGPDSFTPHWGCILLQSVGSQTDRLVQCYADWFGYPNLKAIASEQMECGAVSLASEAPDPYRGKCSFKLFFETPADTESDSVEAEDEYPYAELFFDVDLPSKRAWLREKDSDYRLPLLQFMTGKFATVSSIRLWPQ